jgi:hypothetical protein
VRTNTGSRGHVRAHDPIQLREAGRQAARPVEPVRCL